MIKINLSNDTVQRIAKLNIEVLPKTLHCDNGFIGCGGLKCDDCILNDDKRHSTEGRVVD